MQKYFASSINILHIFKKYFEIYTNKKHSIGCMKRKKDGYKGKKQKNYEIYTIGTDIAEYI